MIKKIEVEAFLKSMGMGVSRPALVRGDDFKEYILKNEKVDNNGNIKNLNCMFLNEMLAYQIGKYLDVPMPDAAIAYVHQTFVDEDPSIRFAYRFEKGNYFASQKLEDIENNLMENMNELIKMGKNYANRTWNSFFKQIDNKDKIVNIIAFDILIANFDRYGNEGNVLVSGYNNKRNIFAIDHGHAFYGPEMTQEKLFNMQTLFGHDKYPLLFANIIKSENGRIFRSLCQHIDLTEPSKNPFSEVVQKIENISEELIDEWLNNIPIEWYIDKKVQVEYYKNFIRLQKQYVRDIIQTMAYIELFDNYLGGVLTWKIEEKLNTV